MEAKAPEFRAEVLAFLLRKSAKVSPVADAFFQVVG